MSWDSCHVFSRHQRNSLQRENPEILSVLLEPLVSSAARGAITHDRRGICGKPTENPWIRRLGGGEGRIRTPGTASTYLGGIQPDLGGLFRPNKSIIDGENMFALDSAVLRSSLLPWSARLTRGIWKRQTSDKGLGVRFSTSQAGSRPSAAQPYLRN
jgi:hypothetical protein